MTQMDEESNIALYIDELKSDDNSLKINAITKLALISSKLSKTRIEQELFPYIRYIIEEMDNEDEFLILISSNILKLLKKKKKHQKKRNNSNFRTINNFRRSKNQKRRCRRFSVYFRILQKRGF